MKDKKHEGYTWYIDGTYLNRTKKRTKKKDNVMTLLREAEASRALRMPSSGYTNIIFKDGNKYNFSAKNIV